MGQPFPSRMRVKKLINYIYICLIKKTTSKYGSDKICSDVENKNNNSYFRFSTQLVEVLL